MSRPESLYSVSELTRQIKFFLEKSIPAVWVDGEISNLRKAPSGHIYFSMKDSSAVISCALFNGAHGVSTKTLEDGARVHCFGRISVYAPRGSYQLVVSEVLPVGEGRLQLEFERLKEKLFKEGLFDQKLKREIPKYPNRIAIITSESGAAIQDILNLLMRRSPNVEVTIVPSLVQGRTAVEQLINGIEVANRCLLGDLIVLARGGGSLEDLWCFNDERLARKIRSSKLPVISAVGHEIDFTISDFVADLRVPTPTAAAEWISNSWLQAREKIATERKQLLYAIQGRILEKRNALKNLKVRLVNPVDRLNDQRQRCDDAAHRMTQAIFHRIEFQRRAVQNFQDRLIALSPTKVLERGYSIVRSKGTDRLVSRRDQVDRDEEIQIQFFDGVKDARII